MNYLYHYCASMQIEIGQIAYASGVITTTTKIATPDDYEATRENIATHAKWDKAKMTINSLSLLGESQSNGSGDA